MQSLESGICPLCGAPLPAGETLCRDCQALAGLDELQAIDQLEKQEDALTELYLLDGALSDLEL